MSTVSLTLEQARQVSCHLNRYKRLIPYHEREVIVRYCIMNSKIDNILVHFVRSSAGGVKISEIDLKEHGSASTCFETAGVFQILKFVDTSVDFGILPVLNLDIDDYSKLLMTLKRLEKLNDVLSTVVGKEIDLSDRSKKKFRFDDHDKNNLLSDERGFEKWYREQLK